MTDNGHSTGTFTADATRSDVNHVYKITGKHGYVITIAHVLDGSHAYCVTATNIGPPAPNTRLGCRTLTVAHNPFGALETATGGTGQITLAGWAIDPDSPHRLRHRHRLARRPAPGVGDDRRSPP